MPTPLKLSPLHLLSGIQARRPLTSGQREGMRTLLRFVADDPGWDDARQVAYMLATIKHECANTWHPIEEMGGRAYCAKYEPGTALGTALGNLTKGDGYKYRGRGYAQITGLANYEKLSMLLGLRNTPDDLVAQPDLALEPRIAYPIIAEGMRRGAFTGKAIGRYIYAGTCDYMSARRVINGTDRAALIRSYALEFEPIVLAAVGMAP